jgi:hypothetical protein
MAQRLGPKTTTTLFPKLAFSFTQMAHPHLHSLQITTIPLGLFEGNTGAAQKQ